MWNMKICKLSTKQRKELNRNNDVVLLKISIQIRTEISVKGTLTHIYICSQS